MTLRVGVVVKSLFFLTPIVWMYGIIAICNRRCRDTKAAKNTENANAMELTVMMLHVFS